MNTQLYFSYYYKKYKVNLLYLMSFEMFMFVDVVGLRIEG